MWQSKDKGHRNQIILIICAKTIKRRCLSFLVQVLLEMGYAQSREDLLCTDMVIEANTFL